MYTNVEMYLARLVALNVNEWRQSTGVPASALLLQLPEGATFPIIVSLSVLIQATPRERPLEGRHELGPPFE